MGISVYKLMVNSSETKVDAVSASTASKILDKSYPTIRRWANEGRIKIFAYVDGMPVFSKQEIERLKKELENNGTPEIREDVQKQLEEMLNTLTQHIQKTMPDISSLLSRMINNSFTPTRIAESLTKLAEMYPEVSEITVISDHNSIEEK